MCATGSQKRQMVIFSDARKGALLLWRAAGPTTIPRVVLMEGGESHFRKNGELAAAALQILAGDLAVYNAANPKSRLYQNNVELIIDNQTEFRLAKGWRAGLGLDGFRVRYAEPVVKDEAVRDGGLGSPPVEGEEEAGWDWNALPAV